MSVDSPSDEYDSTPSARQGACQPGHSTDGRPRSGLLSVQHSSAFVKAVAGGEAHRSWRQRCHAARGRVAAAGDSGVRSATEALGDSPGVPPPPGDSDCDCNRGSVYACPALPVSVSVCLSLSLSLSLLRAPSESSLSLSLSLSLSRSLSLARSLSVLCGQGAQSSPAPPLSPPPPLSLSLYPLPLPVYVCRPRGDLTAERQNVCVSPR